MPIHNADFASVFTGIADPFEIGSANAFRVRAYRNAARSIDNGGRTPTPMHVRGARHAGALR